MQLAGELTIIIAPVTLGAGQRLSGGFGGSPDFEHLGVRQSRSRLSSATAREEVKGGEP